MLNVTAASRALMSAALFDLLVCQKQLADTTVSKPAYRCGVAQAGNLQLEGFTRSAIRKASPLAHDAALGSERTAVFKAANLPTRLPPGSRATKWRAFWTTVPAKARPSKTATVYCGLSVEAVGKARAVQARFPWASALSEQCRRPSLLRGANAHACSPERKPPCFSLEREPLSWRSPNLHTASP